ANTNSPAVTSRSASQADVAVAIPAATAPIPKPSANSRKSRAPRPKTMPFASDVILRLTSSAASSSSRRTSALACSATCLAAGPRPAWRSRSVSWVRMASPVDHLRGEDADGEGCADDEQRRGPAAARLGPLLSLRPAPAELRGRRRRRRRRGRRRRGVLRRLPLRACGDRARLQLAGEGRGGGQLLREPFADPVAAAGRTARELLQARGSALDEEI